ncbi:hypothetical protein [Nitrospirillum sp. BR 11163]|uniref:hypothetical protein n=1 Tax=Nitrospirillum sp. BR 11163 TaxID=3104323 RepID=UPI002B0033E0|nr:hypothetical protein [Nitrospirillum sp. BR 11163]MEA1673463.1 hypothetical protein [Nitrospirillum sp. BR 11163]
MTHSIKERIMRKILSIITVSAMISTAASAGTAWNTHITYIRVTNNGYVLFNVSNHSNDTPACAAASNGGFVFNANTPAGQAQMSYFMTQVTTGKVFSVVGTGDCATWGGFETVGYFDANN